MVRDERLSITALILKLPTDAKTVSSLAKNSPDPRIKFVELPENEFSFSRSEKPSLELLIQSIENQKDSVWVAVRKLIQDSGSTGIAGFLVDMFCASMIDVANEFGVPTHVHFTCSAGTLGAMFHFQRLRDDFNQNLNEYQSSGVRISVPAFANPVHVRVLPPEVFELESGFLDLARNFRKAKGIILTTFLEFETRVIKSLSEDPTIPPVYLVGPVLLVQGLEIDQIKRAHQEEIIRWLDEQPDSSVAFLCYGTRGFFDENQVMEIATALENSGHRFLWSLRKPPQIEWEFPGEYENPEEVLPEGFLERTMGIGKVIRWAPQTIVLMHRAVGGFVSHCGWNSTLESVWCGVPMAVWPLDSDQHLNAFQLVEELQIGVEIKMDYRREDNFIVEAEKIENAIRELMDPENEIRIKVKAMKEESAKAQMEGGSSHEFLGRLVANIVNDLQ